MYPKVLYFEEYYITKRVAFWISVPKRPSCDVYSELASFSVHVKSSGKAKIVNWITTETEKIRGIQLYKRKFTTLWKLCRFGTFFNLKNFETFKRIANKKLKFLNSPTEKWNKNQQQGNRISFQTVVCRYRDFVFNLVWKWKEKKQYYPYTLVCICLFNVIMVFTKLLLHFVLKNNFNPVWFSVFDTCFDLFW